MQNGMSALPPKADVWMLITTDVRFVPIADIRRGYSSMRLSARSKKSRLIGNPMLTTSLSLKSPRPRTPTLHLSAKCSVQLLFTRAKLCCAKRFSVPIAGSNMWNTRTATVAKCLRRFVKLGLKERRANRRACSELKRDGYRLQYHVARWRHIHRKTTTLVPTLTRAYRSIMSWLYMRMHPCETKPPTDPGLLVPWIAY